MITKEKILVYDSTCNFCRNTIHFIKKNSKTGSFTYVPIISKEITELSHKYGFNPHDSDSVLLIEKEKIYFKSTAVIRVLINLKWYGFMAGILLVIPRPIRDFIYDIIARNRYRWFGRCESCAN